MTRRSRAPRFLTDRETTVGLSVLLVVVGGLVVAGVVLPFVDPAAEVYVVLVFFLSTLTYAGWRVGRLFLTRGRADRATPARRRARREEVRERARAAEFDARHPPTDDPYQLGGPPSA